MRHGESHSIGRPAIVAAVVPDWLQAALAVLLRAEPDVRLIACTANVQTLLLLALEQTPDLVLLDADSHDERAGDQVRRIKTAWPDARCLILVNGPRQEAKAREAGADEVLLKGASARRLVTAIRQILSTNGGSSSRQKS